jgi:hypothetical protein
MCKYPHYTKAVIWHDWLPLFTGVESESEPYITTDGQSASLSWNKAPVWGFRPDFYYCQTVAGLLIGALSLTRGQVCRLKSLLVLASAVVFGSYSRGTRGHILLSQILDFPFRRLLRFARGYGGAFRTRLQTGYSLWVEFGLSPLICN